MTTRPAVVLRLLGTFGVVVGDRPVSDAAWPSRRSRELVQLLALAECHSLAREQVLEALWPHLDADAAAANLRKAAHHARQAFDDADAVVLRQGAVRLFPDRAVDSDVRKFSREAADALATGNVERCESAAQAYGGDLLSARYEDWAEGPREELRATYVALLRAAGRWAQVMALEPTDEAACRQLMREALAEGRRAAAIDCFGRLRTTLAQELGVPPDPETVSLYERCVAGVEPGTDLFVDRQRELAALTAVLRRRGDGRHTAVTLSGAAGIGKSALCREIARIARAEGWFTLDVGMAAAGQPFDVVRVAVDALLTVDPGLSAALDDASRSVLAQLDALVPAARRSGQRGAPLTRHQVVGAFRRLLAHAGAGRPVVLLVDDVQHADEGSIDVLYQLAVTGRSVLLVLAHRNGPAQPRVDHLVALLRQADHLLTVELPPLEDGDVRHLVAHVSHDLPPDVAAHIVERAAGNPFVAIELARGAGSASVADAITGRMADVDRDWPC